MLKHEAIMDTRYSLLWVNEIPLWLKRREEYITKKRETRSGRIILWLKGKL